MAHKIHELGYTDSWSRPLYKDDKGNYFCDVNLGRSDEPVIAYKETKDGEPEWIVDSKKIEIINIEES